MSHEFQSPYTVIRFVVEFVTLVTFNIEDHMQRKSIIILVYKLLSCFVACISISGSHVHVSTFQIVSKGNDSNTNCWNT